MTTLLLEDKLTKVFNEIVKKVPKKFGWDDYDTEEENTAVISEALRDAKVAGGAYRGATKAVAVVSGCSSVLKVPYSGKWDYDESVDCDYFTRFEGADNSKDHNWDHCLTEYEVYEAAKENGLDIFFPKTEIMGECESGTIIKQERVLDFYEYCSISEDRTIELVYLDAKYCDLIDSQWIAAAIERYGKAMVDKLIDFLEDNFPIVVEDLHNGNIGFRENGEPIILDFSGWNEDC